MTPLPTRTVRVKMAYAYPEQLTKETKGKEKITYRKAGSPTRPARSTDWNTWYENVEVSNG